MANQGIDRAGRGWLPGKKRDEGVDFWRVIHLLRDEARLIVACALTGLALSLAYALRRSIFPRPCLKWRRRAGP